MHLLTKKEVCLELKRSGQTIREYCRQGLLHPTYLLGRPLFRSDEIEKVKVVGLHRQTSINHFDMKNVVRHASHKTGRKAIWWQA